MECKTVQKQIPLFLKDQLDEEEILDFVDHIESCHDCNEELTIQFLTTEGLNRLEEGGDFDLNHELRNLIARSSKKAVTINNLRFAIGLITMVSVFAAVMALIRMFVL